MSRFSGDDYDEDFPGQWELWQANFERHMNGAAGQRALLDLHAALKAMPEPRLIAGRLADENGQVCTVGALALHRRTVKGEDPETVLEDLAQQISQETAETDSWESEEVTVHAGVSVGLRRMMAQHLGHLNDQDGSWQETPEERYVRVLRWVESKIQAVPV